MAPCRLHHYHGMLKILQILQIRHTGTIGVINSVDTLVIALVNLSFICESKRLKSADLV